MSFSPEERSINRWLWASIILGIIAGAVVGIIAGVALGINLVT